MRGYAEALWGCWRPSATIEAFDPANHYIIERDGVSVGCIAETWQPDHLFIGKLYVDAPFQRQGVGAVVLEKKSAEAGAKGVPIRLSVLTTNPAHAFYRREGFEVETETPERRTMSKQCAATAASGSAVSSL